MMMSIISISITISILSGITIVMVTHGPDVARQTGRIVWFKDGQVVHSHLTPADINRVAVS